MRFLRNLFILITLALFYFGIDSIVNTYSFIMDSTKVNGEVVDYNITESYDSEEGEYYNSFYPIVKFRSEDGEEAYSFTSSVGSSHSPDYPIGASISVLYSLTDNGLHAEINSFSSLWLKTLFLFIFGSFVGIFALVFANAAKKKVNRG